MAGQLAVLGLMLAAGAAVQGPGKLLADLAATLGASDCLSEQERAAAAADIAFLREQLGKNNPARPWQMPAAYQGSVRAAHELAAAGGCANLKAVADDLHLKRLDCEQSGAARMIQVRVSTRRAAGEDPGWQVWSIWVPQSRLLVGRVPLKTLSSPATGELAPGRYRFVLRKGERQTEGGPYAIYGQEVYTLEIPVE